MSKPVFEDPETLTQAIASDLDAYSEEAYQINRSAAGKDYYRNYAPAPESFSVAVGLIKHHIREYALKNYSTEHSLDVIFDHNTGIADYLKNEREYTFFTKETRIGSLVATIHNYGDTILVVEQSMHKDICDVKEMIVNGKKYPKAIGTVGPHATGVFPIDTPFLAHLDVFEALQEMESDAKFGVLFEPASVIAEHIEIPQTSVTRGAVWYVKTGLRDLINKIVDEQLLRALFGQNNTATILAALNNDDPATQRIPVWFVCAFVTAFRQQFSQKGAVEKSTRIFSVKSDAPTNFYVETVVVCVKS